MNKKRTLEERIILRISLKKDNIFIRKDFEDLGGYDQVGRALRTLVKKEKIAKIGYGLYTKIETSFFSGKKVLCKSLPELGREALKKLNIETAISQAEKDYNSGKSTQIPTGRLIRVKGRINRKIGYGGDDIYYECTT